MIQINVVAEGEMVSETSVHFSRAAFAVELYLEKVRNVENTL